MDNDDGEKIFWRLASNEPINIHLHSNLGLAVSTALSKKIRKYGGNPKANQDEAEVIICRKEGPAFAVLTKKYDHDRYKWVEPPSWVDYCISEGKYGHITLPPVLKSYPHGRTEFTPADDSHIVRFLAKRIPYRNMKGRSGRSVWMDLCDRVDLYPWATRHTWQSWRERYAKNREVFDDRIERVVLAGPDPPIPGGKGQYRVRFGKPGPRSKNNRPQLNVKEEGEEEEEEEEEEIDLDEVNAEEDEESDVNEADKEQEATRKDRTPPPAKRRRVEPAPDPPNERVEQEGEQEGDNRRNAETSRPGPSVSERFPSPIMPMRSPSSSPSITPVRERRALKKAAPANSQHVPSPMIQANVLVTPIAASFVAGEGATTHEEGTNTLSLQLEPKQPSPPKPPSKRRTTDRSTNAPQPGRSTFTGLDQDTISNDDEPPAFRTRARTRQSSVESQPISPTRTRTRRAAASSSPPPPPPPPPTELTQPLIDLNQLKKRGGKKPVLKPALIPITEASEEFPASITNDKKISHDEMQIEELLQGKGSGTESISGDNDDGQIDLDSDSSDDMYLEQVLNEQTRAMTEQTIGDHAKKGDQINTTRAVPGNSKQARKMPQTNPPPLSYYTSDGSEDSIESSESGSDSQDVETGSNGRNGIGSLDSQSSVPAVGTDALKYVVSRMPFTPARGTLAEEHVSSVEGLAERTSRNRPVGKGKRGAR